MITKGKNKHERQITMGISFTKESV